MSQVRVDLWARFAAKAEALGATAVRAVSIEDAERVLREEAPAAVATRGLAERFEALARAVRPAANAQHPEREVVWTGEAAVAETGSVLVCGPRADRAAALLAERLWLVVAEGDLVPTLDAGLERAAALVRGGARYVTFMSGPSRTADIERTLTIGVHGPRELRILVLGGA